ncbi:PAS domain S-box protein [Flavobacterium sp. 83]|uniref:PAS domain S-box protein n=1 Tax=Flavobacterium sp. 83 TaxID=1131812 RepID=UPI000ADCEC99|nr:PAS domain S-box protein [Flavobacterium sp. 83]
MGDDIYEVNDAKENEIFADNPLVTGNPNIRFYAGAPLQDANGFNLGSLCVVDTEPRILTSEQKNALKLLAHQVVLLLDLRKKNTDLIKSQREFKNFIELSKDLVCIANVDGFFHKVNPAFTDVLGYSAEELIGVPLIDFIHPEDLDKTLREIEKLFEQRINVSFENRYRCKNGDYILLSWNTSPDPDTGYLYCIARDMTFEYQQKEELVKTSSELSAILNSTDFSIVSSSLNGTIKQFNRGAEKLLGYKSEEVVGKTNPSIFHVWDEVVKRTEDLTKEFGIKITPGYDTFVIKARELGVADSNEWTYVRKDGSLIKIVLSVTAIKNSQGEVTGYLGISKDITKEKEAELNLIRSNKLLDESQSIAKIGSWKFDLVTNQLIWSKGHYQIFDLEELPSDELFKAYRSRIHPDDLLKLDKEIENTKTKGSDLFYNHRILLPNGILKYLVGIGKPFMDSSGKIIGIQGTIQDITERTLAQQKIDRKTKEIRDIKSALDESAIVAVTNQKGVFSYVNENFCTISQYSKEELIGNDQQIISTGDHSIEFRRDVFRTISNGNVWKGEVKNRAKDGSFYWENTTIVPFLNDEGKPYQYIAISTDITEEKLAKENLNRALVDLEKKNKELDQYAYVVSHDLKAPLRAINNLSEWIVEDMPDMPEVVSSNFELLRGRIQRMENLINGVLDYSRVGKTKIEKEVTDLKRVLSQIIDSIVPLEGFEIVVEDTFPVILTEKILIQQVFSNLISNSVKYNDKPIGKIECLYKALPGFHQFTIKDNGPGIAEEYRKKVFEVFQTIEARDKKESTGIGLSIVKKIIEEKGGEIYIESENDNGTSFIFTVPK